MKPVAKSIASLLAAAAMLLPAVVLTVAPAAVAENVPFADGGAIPWRAFGTKTHLYFKQTDPDANVAPGEVPSLEEAEVVMDTFPPRPGPGDVNQGSDVPFTILASDNNAPGPDAKAIVTSANLLYDFNVSGNNALAVSFVARWPEAFGDSNPLRFTVQVKSGGTLAGQVVFTDNQAAGDPCVRLSPTDSYFRCSADVPLQTAHKGRFKFEKGKPLVAEISAAGTDSGLPLPTTTWALRTDDHQRHSWLEVNAENAHMAATWTVDQNTGLVKRLFHPDTKPNAKTYLSAFFTVRSAFGAADLCCVEDEDAPNNIGFVRDFQPEARILYKANATGDGQGFRIPPHGTSIVPLELDTGGNTSLLDGVVTYRFPRNYWNTSQPPIVGGELVMKSSVTIRGDDFRSVAKIEPVWDFVVAGKAAITLRPYEEDLDENPLTANVTLERQDHELAPAGSTTFVFLVRNDASYYDNVTLAIDLASATPSTGWTTRLGGDRVSGTGRIALAPREEAIVTLTVTAPPGTKDGDRVVYAVTARSSVDTTLKSNTYTLTSVVSSTVREGVGIITPRLTEKVQPGIDNPVTVYLWNKGTRATNLTLQLREAPKADWSVDLFRDGVRSRTITVPAVPAGDFAPVTVSVRPDATVDPRTTHNVTLNATVAAKGAAGPGQDKGLRFVPVSLAAARVQLLRGINAVEHYLEMSCQGADLSDPTSPELPRPDSGCTDALSGQEIDAISGTYYRLWITNTGTVADDYTIKIVNPIENVDGNRLAAFPSDQIGSDNFSVGKRDRFGKFTRMAETEAVRLDPTQTAELYVWVNHRNNSAVYQENDFDFTVRVTSREGKQVYPVTARAVGEDADNDPLGGASVRKNAVRIEHVARTPAYILGGAPILDVTNATLPSITKFMNLSGDPMTFNVRVTHGASWKTHVDSDGRTWSSDMKLSIGGVKDARAKGWNISMRPRILEPDEKKNPWKEELSLSNYNKQNLRWEGMADHEIEIKVVPPKNASKVVAGDKLPFTLRGVLGGAATTAEDTLEMVVVVAHEPDIRLRALTKREPIHAGGQTAFILSVENNGSVAAPITLRSKVAASAPHAAEWSLTQQNLNLTPHENRTIALIVGAPSGVVAGESAPIQVVLSYPKFPGDPNSPRVERYENLTVDVRPASKLRITATPTSIEAEPGGRATFALEVRNTDTARIRYEVTGTPIPNWTQSLPLGVSDVEAGKSAFFSYLLEVPQRDVLAGATYDSLVRVRDVSNPDNFETVVLSVAIIGGKPQPLVQAVRTSQLIDRDGTTKFEVAVKNLGNRLGVFPLEAKAVDNRWAAWVEDPTGKVIQNVTVNPNERKSVVLAVKAPRVVAEGLAMAVTLTAFDEIRNPTRSSAATVRAEIHDYGVDVEVTPSRADIIAGETAEFTVKVTNTGTGNDTLNLTGDLVGLTDWRVTFGSEQVQLAPGATADVRAIVHAPREPLPTPRSYVMAVVGGSVGGASVGIGKNDSAGVSVTVLNYVAFDVDGDGFVELAVNRNKRDTDGFEAFREVFRDGRVSRLVDNLSGKADGRIDFLLDVPDEGGYDGVADLYFDPNDPFVYAIEHTPDINGDATPDYLLDTDDEGTIDHAWDTATRRLWTVTTIHAFGGARAQYLVDTNGDDKPDRYYDPQKNLVTKVVAQSDTVFGIDTEGDGKIRKLYDVQSGTVRDASVNTLGDFARSYWYFFVLFLLVVIVFGAVISKRRRGPQ